METRLLAKLVSIAAHLPERTLDNSELAALFPEWSIEKIESKTGIRRRHIVADECASDLALAAAERLLAQHPALRERIDTLIYCTQTPDYFLPSTACVLQDKLRLSQHTAAFDYNLGCSGYIYGLGLAKGMIETGQARDVLLLTADTYSRLIHPRDKSVRTLFGDAGAASWITSREGDSTQPAPIGPFVFGTDGRGKANLIVPAGGFRKPAGPESRVEHEDRFGNCRTDEHLYMNGAELFSFALSRVPELVRAALERAELSVADVDHFVFHQANRFMLEALRDKCHLPPDKFFIGLEEVGNTVSSSIPLALTQLGNAGRLQQDDLLMMVGFGVGYSWGATFVRWSSP
jgi:3-oxoacyl-[acyl-carrier-protein] synthase III